LPTLLLRLSPKKMVDVASPNEPTPHLDHCLIDNVTAESLTQQPDVFLVIVFQLLP
jgi:hypothetical protein